MVGDEESSPKSGVLTSPNYPERYPSNHHSTKTIQVAEGKTIRFAFTSFSTEDEHISTSHGSFFLSKTNRFSRRVCRFCHAPA